MPGPRRRQTSAGFAVMPSSTRSTAVALTSQHPRIWLDDLPLEVTCRIASFVRRDDLASKNRACLSTLHLAESSEHMRQSVLEACSYQLCFPTPEKVRWAALFGDSIRSIKTGGELSYCDGVIHLLKAPTLTSATIPNKKACLESVSRASALKRLSVEFSDHSSVLFLLNALKRLNLVELRLRCVRRCVFKDLFPTREAWAELANLCPKVSVLEVNCICTAKPVELSQYINKFRNLRELTFNRPVADRTLEYLRVLPSVHLRHVCNGGLAMRDQVELAGKIREPVVAIESSYFPMNSKNSLINEDHVAMLRTCPHLVKLDLHLLKGAEAKIPKLEKLKSLRLRWEHSVFEGPNGRDEVYHEPSKQFFNRIIGIAHNLKVLSLFRVRIPLQIVKQILGHTGSNLLEFGTSIAGQDEEPQERLVEIFDFARDHNPSLQKLEVFGQPGAHKDGLSHDFCAYWRNAIHHALGKLKTRAPQLEVKELNNYVNKWLVPGA